MATEFYVARDDGETTGPFRSSDEAILASILELAEDPDAVIDTFNRPAVELRRWYKSLVGAHITHSSLEYGMWLRAAKELIQQVDWVIFGFEMVLDTPEGPPGPRGILHLIEPHQLHSPMDAPIG